jgi:hypothetical protein
MSTDHGAQTALTGFRNRQTTGDDLDCLDKPGDCRSCGADVSDEVCRVMGDNDNRVPVCSECAPGRDSGGYQSDATAISHYRRRTSAGVLAEVEA